MTALAGSTVPPAADAGLRCLKCEYNLTGLSSPRCPECGWEVDWDVTREVRDQSARQIDTPWARWAWYLKPAAFLVTATQVALTPWMFARRIPMRPRVLWPVAFLSVCVIAMVVAEYTLHGGPEICWIWALTSLVCVAVQAVLYRIIAPPRHSRYPLRFWFAVCCYCSYPILVEALTEGPPMMSVDGAGNIYGGDSWFSFRLVTSVLFHLWWLDLVVIAAMRVRPTKWWHVVLVALSVPLLTVGTSHLGVFFYSVFD